MKKDSQGVVLKPLRPLRESCKSCSISCLQRGNRHFFDTKIHHVISSDEKYTHSILQQEETPKILYLETVKEYIRAYCRKWIND